MSLLDGTLTPVCRPQWGQEAPARDPAGEEALSEGGTRDQGLSGGHGALGCVGWSLVDATSYESNGVGGGGADDKVSCGLEGETERGRGWSVCCPAQSGLWGVSFYVKR